METGNFPDSLGDVVANAMLPLRAFVSLLEEVDRGDGVSPGSVGIVLRALTDRAERLLDATATVITDRIGWIAIDFKDDITPTGATLRPAKKNATRTRGKIATLPTADGGRTIQENQQE